VTVDRCIGDAAEHVGEPSLRVNLIKAGGCNQRVDDGSAIGTAL
jgi:hypothetical protein